MLYCDCGEPLENGAWLLHNEGKDYNSLNGYYRCYHVFCNKCQKFTTIKELYEFIGYEIEKEND